MLAPSLACLFPWTTVRTGISFNRTSASPQSNAWAVLQGKVTGAEATGDWLVVDAGTCLTMDLVSGGRHLGGTISPGAQLRLNAMHDHAKALPSIQVPLDRQPLGHASAMGTSTEHAMLAGVFGGMDAEITGKWRSQRKNQRWRSSTHRYYSFP